VLADGPMLQKQLSQSLMHSVAQIRWASQVEQIE
jgi:hypothetical protein